MLITPSCFATARKSSGALLNRCVDVRAITFRSATFASRVRISSCTPSAKKALSGSRLRLSKGKTAIDFRGIVEPVAASLCRGVGGLCVGEAPDKKQSSDQDQQKQSSANPADRN